MQLLRNNYIRFSITLILCLLYSLLRESSYSTYVKPLPVIFWLLIALSSLRKRSAKWVIFSLSLAFVGDIMLDLGDQWLKIATIPFLGSTFLLALAFHFRLKSNNSDKHLLQKGIILLLITLPFVLLIRTLTSYSSDAVLHGVILFSLSIFLLSQAVNNLIFNTSERKNYIKPTAGFIGACGIVANYVLYSIDLYIMPIPRDLVIQVYYWGTAFVTWSFLDDNEIIMKTYPV